MRWFLLLATTVSFAGAAAPPAPQRSFDLQHVALDLRFDWSKRRAAGSASLTLAPLRQTRELRLAAVELDVAAVRIDGLAQDFQIVPETQTLVVQLADSAAAHRPLTVVIDYASTWHNDSDPNNLAGSTGLGLRFFAPTHSEPRERRQLWSSHEPGSARHWHPVSPDPEDAHSFELLATVPAPLTVLAGGVQVEQRDLADGQRSFHWRDAVPRSADRHGFAVGEWTALTQQIGPLTVQNWAYPDEVQATRDSVERLPEMLAWFEQLTGVPFPHASYAQVFVQDLPWGMALPGLAIQTENMVDDFGTHADFLYLWDGLEAESLAHQWYGNHLQVRDLREVWLSRAFAHHLDALWTEHRNGRQEYLLWNLRGDHWNWRNDWSSGTRFAVVPNALPEDPARFTGSNIPLVRGGMVLQMLRRHLGDATWRRVLQTWTRRHAGRTVRTADLRDVILDVSGENLDWFFTQWVYRSAHPQFALERAWDGRRGIYTLIVRQTVQQEPALAEGAQPDFFQGWIEIELDQRIERVWLAPSAEQRFEFHLERAPRWVNFDVERTWLAEITDSPTDAELLALVAHSSDALARFEAITTLVTRAQADGAPVGLKHQVEDALVNVVAERKSYWRLPFLATQQLAVLLAPNAATDTAKPQPATRKALLKAVRETGNWRRAAALAALGLTRDPGLVPLYRQYLEDSSDRVINAAAIALGRSRSPRAFALLSALPARPSWKNQSLISALWGLSALKDPRAEALALRALTDAPAAPRWTLATPVWDYRVAAADTLVAIGKSASGYPIVQERLDRALAAGDVSDVFNNVLLHSVLADPRAAAIWAPLRQHFAKDANALAAIDVFQQQYEAKRAAQPQP